MPRDRFQSKLGPAAAHREERAVRHPVGPALADRHDRHRLEPRQGASRRDRGRHRLPARARQQVLAVPLTRDDVEGVYAGLRPLLAGESEQTSKLSREHIVAHSVPGLVVVAGGKWTTYRIMAKDAIDEAVAALDGKIPTVDHRGHRAARRRGLPGGVEQARQDRAGVRRAQGAHRAPAQPLRRDDRRAARPHPRAPRARRAAARRRRLPRRRGRLRGDARGRPAPRRRARPPHPHLDRGVGPRRVAPRRSPRGSWPRRSAGTRRASQAEIGNYLNAGATPSGESRSSRTTRPPTACASRCPTCETLHWPPGEPRAPVIWDDTTVELTHGRRSPGQTPRGGGAAYLRHG